MFNERGKWLLLLDALKIIIVKKKKVMQLNDQVSAVNMDDLDMHLSFYTANQDAIEIL